MRAASTWSPTRGSERPPGSYYTPDYIVKYIVENTLRPLIDPLVEKAVNQEDGLCRENLPKRLLSLKVLDPAMGSGHFLVEATDYIAREIVHAREMARPEELESEDVAEHDIHWARREVVRNCIYGVDLNPMAVELAKLSLWLTTVASNKPLSFLDHHLRCGNSLIGAKLDGLMALPNSKRDPEQLPMWQFVIKQQKEHTEDLLKQYADMAGRADDDLQTVKWKEEKYKALRESELSCRLYELANVWLSTYFGNQVEEIDYEELQNHLSPNRFPDWQDFRGQEWFRQAQALASEKRFFH
jgi:MmeI, DNA-methyltransferase domain